MPDGAPETPAEHATPRTQTGDLWVLACCCAIVALALVRAMAPAIALPFWDADPLRVYTTVSESAGRMLDLSRALSASTTGYGPTWSVLIDALLMLSSASVLWLRPTGGRWSLLALGGVMVSSAGVLYHGAIHGGDALDHLRIGGAWMSAAWSALALASAGRDPRTRRLLLGVLAGAVVILVLKGLTQVLIEHPSTLRAFEADKDAFFRARGWSPGSPNALAYERRLRQNEASGWFALANVYATFCAASACAGCALLCASDARRVRPGGLCAGLLTALGLLGLILSGSKGGIGTALLVGAVVLAMRWPSVRARSGVIVAACIALPLLAVISRGLLGEVLSERSLFFRWFYWVGSARIFAEHPILGVGPAGFQDAYSRLKPPISPEEVASPHSVFLDYLSMLGLLGVGLCVCLIVRLASMARDLRSVPSPAEGWSGRARWYALCATVIGAMALALWLERGSSLALVLASGLSTSDPPSMAALLAALAILIGACALWIACAHKLDQRWAKGCALAIGLALGGLAVAVHAQIEMTVTVVGSCALAWAWVGLSGPEAPTDGRVRRHRVIVSRLGAGACALIGLAVLLMALPRVASWEARLADAAQVAAPVGQMRSDLRALARTPPPLRAGALTDLAQRLKQDLGEDVPPTIDGISAALDRLALARGEESERILDAAHEPLGGSHRQTLRAQIRLLRSLASEARRMGLRREAQALLVRALARGERLAGEHPDWAGSWNLLGMIHMDLSDFTDSESHKREALAAWEHEASLDPHSLSVWRRIAELALDLGQRERASSAARRALEIDEQMRLDPLRQLDEATRARLEAIARNP